MKIYPPKYVKRANMWCVTTFGNGKQEIKWFNTKGEADNFIEEMKIPKNLK